MNKAHILEEIKRTAEANGGVPLGWQRFTTETGIKKHDWFGVHWARWSDAVSEAGLAPNKLDVAYEKTDLLDRYARLALELGRLPTMGELRLKARRDPGFPSDKAFDRLGTKPEIVTKLGEYCRGRDGYEGVVRFCESYTLWWTPLSRPKSSVPSLLP